MSATKIISEKGGRGKAGNRIGHGLPQEETPYVKGVIKRNREAERGENPLLSRNCDGSESRDCHWKICSNSLNGSCCSSECSGKAGK